MTIVLRSFLHSEYNSNNEHGRVDTSKVQKSCWKVFQNFFFHEICRAGVSILSGRDVVRVDEECLQGYEEGGAEAVPAGDHPNNLPLVLWEPGDGDEHSGDLDHGSCTGTDDAVGEGEGGDAGVEGEVGEEGGQAEQHAAEHQTTTLTKHRHENQAT